MHVPELIKKHTHHRTVYKHHYKVKPKPKPKPPRKPHHYHHHEYEHHHHHEHDRVDPSIRHGTLHGKYQRPYWTDHLLPAASHYKESKHKSREEPSSTSTESSYSGTTAADSPEILTRWNHNFKLLNQKPTKKTPKKKITRTTTTSAPPPIEYSQDNGEEEETSPHNPYKNFDFNEHYYGDIGGTQHEHHIYKQPIEQEEYNPQTKYSTIFQYPEVPKLKNPFLNAKIKDTFGMPRYEELHASHSQSEFSPPHLLKITEDDIRKRPKSTSSSKKSPEPTSYGGSDSYLNWDTFQWTTPRPDPNVEHHYLRPTSGALHTMAELVSQEEFMPSQQQQYPIHQEYDGHKYPSETDDDEETAPSDHQKSAHSDFGIPMASMTDDLYRSFTKRKNIRSGQSPLVVTMDR